MARVTIEDRFFGDSRLYQLTTLMAWDQLRAVGCMSFLWHESQSQLKNSGTREEIELWTRLPSHEVEKFLEVTCKIGLLKKMGDRFHIAGNREHVANLSTYKKNSRKGGEATRKKWHSSQSQYNQQVNVGPGGLVPASREQAERLAESRPNSIQFNSYNNTPRSRSVFDFEGVYKKYPRKDGKTAGLRYCERKIKNQEEFEKLEKSVINYAEHCRKEKPELRFIPYFSTFVGTKELWRDWMPGADGLTPVMASVSQLETVIDPITGKTTCRLKTGEQINGQQRSEGR